MKTLKKLFVRLVLVLLALLVVLFLCRNFVARKSVEVGVKQLTGFPLEIGGVDLAVFRGQFGVENLKLMNPPEFAEKNFVDLPLFRVDYHTISMLTGTPHIKELVVNVKEVVIVKNEKGVTNADLIQAKLTPAKSEGAEPKPQSEKKTEYRVDLVRVYVGTVVQKDYSKGKLVERRVTMNREIVLKDVTESSSLSALVMKAVLGPVGDVAGDLMKGAGGALKSTGDAMRKTTEGIFDVFKKK
jgi:uncharacterized protein involved in outer membrane biogenesis